ncbi:class I SAM-dependent methyltransferase [Thiohalomonas denitrificans]|uniref:Phosphatidylethanolamine N-methyltransferase /phosphatidyl-N-methylethanolamine N-methyltransferase n=1 Tax=Thiohalomonas denitrificans TaxID=415747 RepID=A0A1G5Q662_9GAMM|nr:class I SAM-dependent methyltransferase [Thiohalomonas denitrificans]SCZ57167.1 phosphatidylethanolamine N-methyltransferase /phosphatidyl-N-methylethanolamine N-methyltransferase [Thiohalomonas denitrificans]
MDHNSVISAYRRYAGIYDFVFGSVFEPGRQRVVEMMDCRPGENILEAGVGTGLSLTHYPAHADVVGIDLSPDMLDRAGNRVRKTGLGNATLHCMDVQEMGFPDDSFDKVACMYVASVVPDPVAMLAEVKRVCRPGGDIFVVNHFTSSGGPARWMEEMLSPLAKRLGFRPIFPMDEFIELADMEVAEVAPVNAFGYWTLVHLRNSPRSLEAVGEQAA